MYKEASRLQLRVQTNKGLLSIEQLWSLSVADLDALAVSLEDEYKASGKKSFLTVRSVKDKTAKLKFDIVLDILNTKVEEAEVAKQKKDDKEHNDKIFKLIAEKQEAGLSKLSIRQLEAQLR